MVGMGKMNEGFFGSPGVVYQTRLKIQSSGGGPRLLSVRRKRDVTRFCGSSEGECSQSPNQVFAYRPRWTIRIAAKEGVVVQEERRA